MASKDKPRRGKAAKAPAPPRPEGFDEEIEKFEPTYDDIDAVTAVEQGEARGGTRSSIDDESKLETLIPNVLSMSESLLELAETSGQLSTQLRQDVAQFEEIMGDYDELLVRKDRHAMILMGVSVGVIVLSLLLVLVMTFSFSRQVNNMNALSLTLGRRLSEVNSGLVTFEELNGSIGQLEAAVLAVAKTAEAQQLTMDKMVDSQQTVNEGMQKALADAMASQAAAVKSAVGNLESAVATGARVQDQSMDVLQSLRLEVDAVGTSTESLLGLRQSIDALITLEKERYLERLDAQRAAVAAESQENASIRFQRPVPPPPQPAQPQPPTPSGRPL